MAWTPMCQVQFTGKDGLQHICTDERGHDGEHHSVVDRATGRAIWEA